jgi:formylglycine-generating enzyme required for sulfatase activity
MAAALVAGAMSCADPETVTRDRASGIELRLLPAGEFRMGTPPTELGREAQETLHRVRLTRSFYIGVTEVTQAQWRTVMGANPSHFSACGLPTVARSAKEGPECPVETVNFDEVLEFLAKLNALSTGGFRLPTEAEWEYACRAGGTEPFGQRQTLGSNQSNVDGRFPYGEPVSRESTGTIPVARFEPNAWGLHDMSGNVWEWTEDWHCPYPDGDATDPVGRCESQHRVIRGGSWKFDANSARCGLRYTHRPQDRGFSLGFRVARTAR